MYKPFTSWSNLDADPVTETRPTSIAVPTDPTDYVKGYAFYDLDEHHVLTIINNILGDSLQCVEVSCLVRDIESQPEPGLLIDKYYLSRADTPSFEYVRVVRLESTRLYLEIVRGWGDAAVELIDNMNYADELDTKAASMDTDEAANILGAALHIVQPDPVGTVSVSESVEDEADALQRLFKQQAVKYTEDFTAIVGSGTTMVGVRTLERESLTAITCKSLSAEEFQHFLNMPFFNAASKVFLYEQLQLALAKPMHSPKIYAKLTRDNYSCIIVCEPSSIIKDGVEASIYLRNATPVTLHTTLPSAPPELVSTPAVHPDADEVSRLYRLFNDPSVSMACNVINKPDAVYTIKTVGGTDSSIKAVSCMALPQSGFESFSRLPDFDTAAGRYIEEWLHKAYLQPTIDTTPTIGQIVRGRRIYIAVINKNPGNSTSVDVVVYIRIPGA